jgi:hypothetical protein
MTVELVFNLAEVGVSEWEDLKDKKVVIPGLYLVRRYIMAFPEI